MHAALQADREIVKPQCSHVQDHVTRGRERDVEYAGAIRFHISQDPPPFINHDGSAAYWIAAGRIEDEATQRSRAQR
jgi:hypothetical protein